MLQLLLMAVLVAGLVRDAKDRGRSGWWGALGVALWFAGEMLGALISLWLGLDGVIAFLPPLLGGLVGYGIARFIIRSMRSARD